MKHFTSNTPLNIARILYLIVCEFAGMAFAYQILGPEKIWVGILFGLIVAIIFMFIESLTKSYTIRGFSTGTFGLLIGIFCAWLLTRVGVPNIIASVFNDVITNKKEFDSVFNTMLFASLGFLGTVISLRSGQDDFAVVIPYVRFRSDATSGRPLLIDAEVITDGRLLAVMKSGFLEQNLIIPKFILDELQIMSNSPSPGRKQRGQRGLDCLENLRSTRDIKLTVHFSEPQSADDNQTTQLLQISRLLNAMILTTDDNLTKVAKLQNVSVINLNDINEALKPLVDLGTRLQLALVRTGKEDHQGVGYLPDGTMIVVNNAISKIGTTQSVTVISTINTTAGLMVFADLESDRQANDMHQIILK